MIFSMLIASHSWIFWMLMFIGKDLFMASWILYGAWRETRVSHLELFRQAILGYIRQAILGSKFQMRDQCLSLSTRRYQQTLFIGLLTQSRFNFWKLSPMEGFEVSLQQPPPFCWLPGGLDFFRQVELSLYFVHFYFLLSYPRSSLAFFRCSYYCYHCSLNIGGGDHEKLIILLQLYAILMPPIK